MTIEELSKTFVEVNSLEELEVFIAHFSHTCCYWNFLREHSEFPVYLSYNGYTGAWTQNEHYASNHNGITLFEDFAPDLLGTIIKKIRKEINEV